MNRANIRFAANRAPHGIADLRFWESSIGGDGAALQAINGQQPLLFASFAPLRASSSSWCRGAICPPSPLMHFLTAAPLVMEARDSVLLPFVAAGPVIPSPYRRCYR